MMDLAEFLLARIAEDESVATRWPEDEPPPPAGRPYWIDAYGHPIWAPRARVLAECDAKRRILENEDPLWTHDEGSMEAILCLLALPHADHPDYDESWRP